MLTGLPLAIAFVYVREFFDHRFKHPAPNQPQAGHSGANAVINDQNVLPGNPHRTGPLPSFLHWVRN